ncbi:M23 family metallopeptidase, partial [Patescibacteria group bacterium]|nr:M23 family metallopeptidase [Patescibacteria group bacterium]
IKGTYAYSLRQGLNKFNFIPNTSKKTFRFITGGRYESFGGIIRGTIYQKALKPFLIRLGRTAVGKTTKTIFTKLSTRLAIRLGLSALTAGWATFISFLPLIKRMAKKALAIVGGLLLWAAHFGTAAVLGTLVGSLGGAIGGGIAGFKIGALIGTSFSIVGTVIGAIVGTVIGAIVGFFGGIGIQLLIDKIKASLSSPLLQKVNIASREIATATVTTSGNVLLGTVAGVGIGALVITQITASAFLIPELEELEGSPYIQLSKTGDFIGDEETGIGEIAYSIEVGAKEENLIEVEVNDEFSTNCRDKKPNINSGLNESPPKTIESGNSWKSAYTVQTDKDFKDCLIINKITVTGKIASLPEETQQKTATVVVVIGNPPDDCPKSWPVTGYISQLPSANHKNAVDIANGEGSKSAYDEKYLPVYATHKGTASNYEDFLGDKQGGYYVLITGYCQGKPFQTAYMHLKEDGRATDEVKFGDIIGYMNNSGISTGPHLHYVISGLIMKDFIPPMVDGKNVVALSNQ